MEFDHPDDDGTFATAHGGLLSSCSCIVGMHPDQATEPIVDFALARRKPFAVVPCCVFPKLFPARWLPRAQGGGAPTPVVDYAQFVEYLRAKSPAIETAYLNTKGRNLILFSRGGGGGTAG